MKPKPLNDLEMFDLLRAAYPEKFNDDVDETWDAVQQFAEDFAGWDDVADLLGRVVMLSMPMVGGFNNRLSHALGPVSIKEGKVSMVSAVQRNVD